MATMKVNLQKCKYTNMMRSCAYDNYSNKNLLYKNVIP